MAKKHSEFYWAMVVGYGTKYPYFAVAEGDPTKPRLFNRRSDALSFWRQTDPKHRQSEGHRVVRVKVIES